MTIRPRTAVLPSRAVLQDIQRGSLMSRRYRSRYTVLKEYDGSWDPSDLGIHVPINEKALVVSEYDVKGVVVMFPEYFAEAFGTISFGKRSLASYVLRDVGLKGVSFSGAHSGILLEKERGRVEQEALVKVLEYMKEGKTFEQYSAVERVILLGVDNYDNCVLEAIASEHGTKFKHGIKPKYI